YHTASHTLRKNCGKMLSKMNAVRTSRNSSAARRRRFIRRIPWHRLKEHPLARVGPGLITGAADDDPSGIATYSQAGAQFGLNLLWTVVVTYPLMVGIQTVSARIGRVTGRGLAANIRRHYPAWLLYAVVALLVVANTINIAADIAAMGEALQLLVGGPQHGHALLVGIACL